MERKSSLDMLRKLEAPSTYEGEDVLLFDSASCDVGKTMVSSWRLGQLYLTTNHLIFVHGPKKTFNLNLDNIKCVSIIERPWVMGKMIEQLCVVPKVGKIGQRVFYIGVKNPKTWKEAIEGQKPE